MRIDRTRRKLDFKAYKNRHAVESDFKTLIDEPFNLYEDGDLILSYIIPDENLEPLRLACKTIKYNSNFRQGGLKTTSRVFGYEPRKTLRKDFCSATTLGRDFPKQNKIIIEAASMVGRHYQKANPDLYTQHSAETAKKVKEDWRMKDAPFTSGIINENNPLKYHFDSGNYRNVWSGMVVFKEGISGGHLSLPEFDIGITLRDKSILYFDGQGVLHGVTPINRLSEHSKRYSVVYYSLKGIWNCQPLNEEIIRIRNLRTQREENRKSSSRKTTEHRKSLKVAK